MNRIGLVVHPRREIGSALESLRRWSAARDVDVVQVPAAGQARSVAPAGDPAACDLIVAVGGDGTTLAALGAASVVGKPVLGVACGSLGALTAVTSAGLVAALDRVVARDWAPRRLPALAVDTPGQATRLGVNDLVVVRHGAGQVIVTASIDGELFVRYAGDGLVVATALGSSAYTLAAGGPLVAPGAGGFVFTPLAAHGGCCPSLVAGGGSRVTIEVDPGFGGARIELDGQIQDRLDPLAPQRLEVTLRPDHATLVTLDGEESMIAGLRRRRVLIDSPRVLARDDRASAA